MTDVLPISPAGTGYLIDRDALLPCPFCGGEASANGHMKWSRPVEEATWDDGSPITEAFFCNCQSCGVSNIGTLSIGHQTRSAAIDAWNRRALPPTAHDVDAALRRAEQAECREAALIASNDADRMALRNLNAERDALRAEKAKLEGLVDTLAEELSAIDPAGKLDCELRANALAEYQEWKEGK